MKNQSRKSAGYGIGAKTSTLILVLMLMVVSVTVLATTRALAVTPSPYCEGSDCCISSGCSCSNRSGIGKTDEDPAAETEVFELGIRSDEEIPIAPFIEVGADYSLYAPPGVPSWSILAVLLTISGVIIALMFNINALKQKQEDEKRSRKHIQTLRNTDKSSYYKTIAIMENEKLHNRRNRLSLFSAIHIFMFAGILLLVFMQNFNAMLVLFNWWVVPHVILVACIAIAGKCTFQRFAKMPAVLLIAITLFVGGSAIAFSGQDAVLQDAQIHTTNYDYCPCSPSPVQEDEFLGDDLPNTTSSSNRQSNTNTDYNNPHSDRDSNNDENTNTNDTNSSETDNGGTDNGDEPNPENPPAAPVLVEGTFPLIGNPWLGEILSYGEGLIIVDDSEGSKTTQTFSPDMLSSWHHLWMADGEPIKDAYGTTYVVSALDRTENDNDVMNTQIGLTLTSDCGNFILRQEEPTARVPYDVRLEFDTYPARRSADNAALYSGHADDSLTNNKFRRQVVSGNVEITNTLSDGYMGDSVGVSRADFRIGDKHFDELTARGFDTITYTVNPEDAVDGVITIRVTYTHIGISVASYDVFALGYQTCMETLDWREITVRNIGNTETGEIQFNFAGENASAFETPSGDYAVFNNLFSYGDEAAFSIRPYPGNLANELTGYHGDASVADTLLSADIELQFADTHILSEVTVTIRHGGQSAFEVSGNNCRSVCTVVQCSRVTRRHETTRSGWVAGGIGCVRVCTVPNCNAQVEAHIANLNNPVFTGADNGATCSRTRTCQAAGCGRPVIDSHQRGGSQGGTWAANGANCRRTSSCTVAGCGRANAWVQQHSTVQSGWAAGGSGCRRVCSTCSRQTATHTVTHVWTRGGNHPHGVGGLTRWCEAVCGGCGRATVARQDHIMVQHYASQTHCARHCARGCPEHQSINHAGGTCGACGTFNS
ncbi:MAG: hypothetical protein FWC20_02885 [Oscillospiraceae bacterium]|nr:hypothetical protein [Oscillospiraceae bacterium]MCL2278340.1 hypothetical protein [Oscillospiraceae bacterium]